jgi:signal transduction histidine kinase
MGDNPRRRSIRRAALSLMAVNLVLPLALWGAAGPSAYRLPGLASFFGFCAAFALVASLPMSLDFSEHRATFTLTDAVLVIGLFHMSAVPLGLAATIGEVTAGFAHRTPPLKAAFNAASRMGAVTLAAAAYSAIAPAGRLGPATWGPALTAALCWGVLNVATVSVILATAEGRSFTRTLKRSIPTALVTTALAAPLGLLVAQLLGIRPVLVLLVIPVATGVWMTNRYAAAQRDEHLRVERLYEATTRTALLPAESDVVATIADEARQLLTAGASLCFLREEDGAWVGRTARADGVGDAGEDDLAALLEALGSEARSVTGVAVPAGLQAACPDAEMMVIARSPQRTPVQLVVGVLRRRSDDRRPDSGFGDTLSAFAAHGAVIAANSLLLARVRSALVDQLDANRRKDEFVATVSHELRTPLTVMLGTAQTLLRLDDRVGTEDRRSLLVTAVGQGKRLQVLIEDLLLVASAESGATSRVTSVHADQLAAEMASDLPPELRQRVVVNNRSGTSVLVLDDHKVRQIIANLIGNAAKYAPAGPVEVDLAADDGWARFVVSDHGPGIRKGDRNRVFERFVQLDQTSTRSQGGTGLGLYVCKRLATQLGGTLELRTTPGGGCTFELSVPSRSTLHPGEPSDAHTHRAPPAGLMCRPPVVSPRLVSASDS